MINLIENSPYLPYIQLLLVGLAFIAMPGPEKVEIEKEPEPDKAEPPQPVKLQTTGVFEWDEKTAFKTMKK